MEHQTTAEGVRRQRTKPQLMKEALVLCLQEPDWKRPDGTTVKCLQDQFAGLQKKFREALDRNRTSGAAGGRDAATCVGYDIFAPT